MLRFAFRLRLLRQDHRHELLGDLVVAGFDAEVADDAERERTDKVDKQILHRVIQTDIQITAETKRLAVHSHVRDIIHQNRNIVVRRVERHGGEGVDDRVLLHVHVEEVVH